MALDVYMKCNCVHMYEVDQDGVEGTMLCTVFFLVAQLVDYLRISLHRIIGTSMRAA